jgi:ATP-binding cassette, subfamily B, bacterial
LRYRAYLTRSRRGQAEPGELQVAGSDAAPVDKNHPSKLKRSRSFAALSREFWHMLRGKRGIVLACVGTVTLSTLVGLLAPASTKIAIDYIITDQPGPTGLPEWVLRQTGTEARVALLMWLGGALMAVTPVAIGIGIWGRYQMTRLTKLMQVRVRRRVFGHAVRLPLHRIYELKSGGAASILREDAGASAELLFSLLYNPWRAVVQLVCTLAILATVDWRLLAAGLAMVPAAWFSQKTWIGRIRPLFRDVRHTRQTIDAQSTESFGGMRIVRAFNRSHGEAGRFVNSNHLLVRQELLTWWWGRGIEIAWMVLIPLASAAILVYGGWRVTSGTLTLGDMMMFSAYLLMMLGPLEALSESATSIQSQLASLDRVLDLLSEPAEFERAIAPGEAGSRGEPLLIQSAERRLRQVPGRVIKPSEVRGRITLQGVSFRYPKSDRDVLTGIDLDVRAGSTVALVGMSGAGKTTLCNLVARFYDPSAGRVLLDGEDLREIKVDSYRALLGVVEQDVFLFDGTVAENIGYARRRIGMDRVREAARAAHAAEFIEKMERGYDTLIGERGVRLSGGQKQRIAIARAVLADPRILILDEATSNLDSESEQLIQASLTRLMRGRTSFVIAHRLSTIRHADQILVMEAGRIIETGTHEELSTRGGRYSRMLEVQLGTMQASG